MDVNNRQIEKYEERKTSNNPRHIRYEAELKFDGRGRCAFAAPGRVVGVRNKPEGEKRICQGAKRRD